MAFDAFRELQIMNDKLLNVGQYTWLNLILTEWGKAYRQAYTTVYGVKQQTASLPWFIGILGGIVGSQAMFVQVSFAPLFVGLSKMSGESTLVDPKVTQKPEDYIDDRKIEFARMLKVCSDSIIKLRDKVKDNPDIMTADDFQVFLSRSLLSPIWYPPKEPDVDQLAKKFERKMWAQAYYDATETPQQARQTSTAKIWNEYMDSRDLSEDGGKGLDPKVLEPLYHDFEQRLRNTGMGEVEPLAIRRNVKYIVQELARPSPIDYPLPAYVSTYLQILSAYKGITLGFGDPGWLLNKLPPIRLTWDNVPL